jgi:hypothetical protein
MIAVNPPPTSGQGRRQINPTRNLRTRHALCRQLD